MVSCADGSVSTFELKATEAEDDEELEIDENDLEGAIEDEAESKESIKNEDADIRSIHSEKSEQKEKQASQISKSQNDEAEVPKA